MAAARLQMGDSRKNLFQVIRKRPLPVLGTVLFGERR